MPVTGAQAGGAGVEHWLQPRDLAAGHSGPSDGGWGMGFGEAVGMGLGLLGVFVAKPKLD